MTRTTRRALTTILPAAALAATAALGLAGCSAGAAPAGQQGASTPTASAPSGESTGGSPAASQSASSGTADGPAPGEQCGVNPSDARIADAIPDVPSPFASGPNADTAWGSTPEDTNFDPCAELSYATLSAQGGTASSPEQVMLFRYGTYVGTTSDCAPGFQEVRQNDADSITVTYRWPEAGDSNANPTGSGDVMYSIVNGEVTMSNPIPEQAISQDICHTWPPVQ